ncbi:MAG: 5-(carboxyamino)imidazole ribonucleotide synthase, partial [Halobacteria archaeon]|nr:5-(carboxyamino)imidazole ribonucleotide synthase [Halobacteria archaeon]
YSADRASLHWYGKKEVRPLRKMGHFTMTLTGADRDDDSRDELLEEARRLKDELEFL